MGNKSTYQSLVNNVYCLDEKFLREFIYDCENCDYEEDDFLDIVNHHSDKVLTNAQRPRPRSKSSLLKYYNYSVAAITVLESLNVNAHPETNESWGALVQRMQQIVGFQSIEISTKLFN